MIGNTFIKGDEFDGKPLYVLWQPHPGVTFDPFEKNCHKMDGCKSKTTAVFNEPGPKTVWAEIMAVDGPRKVIVGEASMEVNVVMP